MILTDDVVDHTTNLKTRMPTRKNWEMSLDTCQWGISQMLKLVRFFFFQIFYGKENALAVGYEEHLPRVVPSVTYAKYFFPYMALAKCCLLIGHNPGQVWHLIYIL